MVPLGVWLPGLRLGCVVVSVAASALDVAAEVGEFEIGDVVDEFGVEVDGFDVVDAAGLGVGEGESVVDFVAADPADVLGAADVLFGAAEFAGGSVGFGGDGFSLLQRSPIVVWHE